ncbi:PilZ domain-containing protein [Methylobacterium sp. UNC300MFChir4.1]|uniref:PilZ domain-containing protein n=1 Tax=Methylobacterium sp. UNC300MFChir4.1 TaxID=1502747 RepID=UPI0008BECD82|nr:PilZ domain-containing protein [Methylobacterium sp. UNC300MFChir4.1]SEO80477.1 PilZ domain-containing protein [Methylobacterium sp. UNC300MFChir4.1]
MVERRRTARRRVCLGGRLRVAAFLPEIDCTVRDVSLDGARVRLPAEALLPDCVELFIPCRGETRRAFVAWRAGESVGLGFAETRAATEPEAVARRLAASEAEVARLRAALLDGNSPEPGRVH